MTASGLKWTSRKGTGLDKGDARYEHPDLPVQERPPAVMERLAKFRKGEIGISSIAWSEYLVGLYKKGITDGQFGQFISVIPFDAPAANIFSKLTAKYPDRPKGFDRLIAAHAIAVGVKLVTTNTADFALYLDDGLAVENWV